MYARPSTCCVAAAGQGKPVVIVHGGPGGGCSPQYRTFHDPEAYRIILFDQRGAKNERLLSWSHY